MAKQPTRESFTDPVALRVHHWVMHKHPVLLRLVTQLLMNLRGNLEHNRIRYRRELHYHGDGPGQFVSYWIVDRSDVEGTAIVATCGLLAQMEVCKTEEDVPGELLSQMIEMEDADCCDGSAVDPRGLCMTGSHADAFGNVSVPDSMPEEV